MSFNEHQIGIASELLLYIPLNITENLLEMTVLQQETRAVVFKAIGMVI